MIANPEQLSAINSNADKLLIMAGAGAGKTFVMIQRVIRLVNEGIDPNSILVLTFTNNAAFEMKERYEKQNPGKISPEFRTFHGFCYSLIVKDSNLREKMGYTQIPTIADENQVKKLEKDAKMQVNLRIPTSKMKFPELLDKSQLKQLDIYHKAVQKMLRQNNLITFDILCYQVCQYFVDDDPCIQEYKNQYKYLFVDEFQDTDPRQIDFLKSFKNINWFLCGDALQNIYGFRGCSNDTLKQLSSDPEWEKIKMYQNYRSTNQICDFANKHSKSYAEDSYRINMKGNRDGDDVTIITGSHVNYQNPVDIRHLHKIIKLAENRTENMAIICRSNREVNVICDMLRNQHIEYNSSINTDNLHILKSVISNDYMLNWLASHLTSEVFADYIRQAANTSNPDIHWFANVYGKYPEIQLRGTKILNIRKILQNIRMTNEEKCVEIFKELYLDNIELDDIEFMNSTQLVQYLISCLEETSSTDLYVGTIHSVKGLEYDHVVIVGAYDKNFRIDSEENKNIYYVAITRAKNHLTIFTE